MFKTFTWILSCPIWALQLFTGAKSFRDNPLIGSRALNERGLHVLRQAMAHRATAWRRRRLGRGVPAPLAAAFARDGFVVVPDFLPAEAFSQLLDDVTRYRGPARETIQGDTVTRRIALDPRVLAGMPGMRRLLDRRLLGKLTRLAGGRDCEPLYYIQTILPHAVTGDPDPQLQLHADTFHPTVKAWFTLTDVAEDSSPFIYVPGSHIITPARRAWEKRMSIEASGSENRLTGRGSFRVDEDIISAMGYPPPRSFPLPANTLIVADTGGFHARGAARDAGIRVEVWAYERGNPFCAPPVDLWRIPALGRWRVPVMWAFGDWLEESGLGRQVWRRRGTVGAFDRDVAGHAAAKVRQDMSGWPGRVSAGLVRKGLLFLKKKKQKDF
ncbi:phytanoyl-CoA dioxygenase [Gluconacetobacter diazotrophicus]|uniref:Phytanoyl-CoA dioxygenase n=1 Tax=Gluconacetobacter diazotrophicus TaxID=33996 RepID=A0A7W4I917_GLUDI|nr:phytanoyl-CoA dioxygenase family protein [Gluconacetobacter diazotrophicus]MBB2158461.1 phytanoyl-CoA dioxygenase [Gluconacetobacter diazotrophicus]